MMSHLSKCQDLSLYPRGKTRIDTRQVIFTIVHFDGQHQVSLRTSQSLFSLYLLTHLPPLGRGHDPDIPTIFPVQVVHHPTKHDTMRRGIAKPRIGYGVMYHLMKQHTLGLTIGHVVIGCHRYLEIVKTHLAPPRRTLKRHLSQTGSGTTQSHNWQWQLGVEIGAVECFKPSLHPFHGYYHDSFITLFLVAMSEMSAQRYYFFCIYTNRSLKESFDLYGWNRFCKRIQKYIRNSCSSKKNAF